jgi:hypothetical protein
LPEIICRLHIVSIAHFKSATKPCAAPLFHLIFARIYNIGCAFSQVDLRKLAIFDSCPGLSHPHLFMPVQAVKPKSAQSIIVTGGAGFIGSNIVDHLNQSGHKNGVVLGGLSEGHKFFNIRHATILHYLSIPEFLALIEADDSLYRSQAILHMGATTSTTEWNRALLIQNNFTFTKKPLKKFRVTNTGKIRPLRTAYKRFFGIRQGVMYPQNHPFLTPHRLFHRPAKKLFDWHQLHRVPLIYAASVRSGNTSHPSTCMPTLS